MSNEVEQKKSIKTINDLPGISQTVINKLIEAGYSSLETLAVASPQDLSVAAGIPLSTAQKIIKEARDALDIRFKTALEVKKERMNVKKILSLIHI